MDGYDKKTQGNWHEVARKVQRYKATINVKHLSSTNINQAVKVVTDAICDINDFNGTRRSFYNKEMFILAEFGTIEARDTACNRVLEKDNEHKLTALINKGDDSIKK